MATLSELPQQSHPDFGQGSPREIVVAAPAFANISDGRDAIPGHLPAPGSDPHAPACFMALTEHGADPANA
ncbi:hypothetical protein [Burkholderia puraquae]|uniref:hypothetical protein n=1 Tax=Burkholderia puraquae TaxID=1904757 RepID=UPI0010542827|nr:hypothetical protein [Burkholderia puraquae]